jgi:hypothetical protein
MADRVRAIAACAKWAFIEEVPEYVEVACVGGAGTGGGFPLLTPKSCT